MCRARLARTVPPGRRATSIAQRASRSGHDMGLSKDQFRIALRRLVFQNVASSRGVGVEASVNDPSVPDLEQKQMFVFHQITVERFCPRKDRDDDVIVRFKDRSGVVSESLPLLINVLPEG